MKAQSLYNYRDETAMISGQDLHDVFQAVCGEPSPAGRTPIEPQALAALAIDCAQRAAAHTASGGVGGQYLQDMALFLVDASNNCGDALVGDIVRGALGRALADVRAAGGNEEPIRALYRRAGVSFEDEEAVLA